jgi:hypothetical protein
MMPMEKELKLPSELAPELKLPLNYQELVKHLLGEDHPQATVDTISTVPHVVDDLFKHKIVN